MNYTYTISTSFPNGKVSLDRLTKEIRDSSITIALDYINTNGNVCDIYFKSDLSDGDAITLNSLVANHSGEPLVQTPVTSSVTIDGGAVQVTKPTDTKLTIVTHDFTDKTTWYEGSIFVHDEIAHDSGSSHTVYTASHAYLIDTYHGKLTDEDFFIDSASRSYRISVKVDDVLKTEQNPHYASGGDYIVNYESGSISFLTPLTGSETVKITYHYAASSIFTVKPPMGYIFCLDLAEVQFSVDVIAKDSAVFQPRGYVQSFVPQYCPNPYPLNTLIPLGNAGVYKSISDFLNVSTRAYPAYKAVGGNSWRGMPVDVNVYDWDYASRVMLDSSKGMEIQIKMQHDEPWDGYYATAAFYGVLKPS